MRAFEAKKSSILLKIFLAEQKELLPLPPRKRGSSYNGEMIEEKSCNKDIKYDQHLLNKEVLIFYEKFFEILKQIR